MTTKKFLGTVLLLLAPAAMAMATVLRPLSLEELVHDADAIVRARVLRVESRGVDAEHVRICATLAVDEAFKGNVASTVVVCERGGTLPTGETLFIAGTPRYSAGHAVLAMLSARPDGSFRTTGFTQGLFHIVRDTDGTPQTLLRDFDDVSWLTETGAVAETNPPNVAARLVARTVFAQIRSLVGGAQ